MLKSQKPNFKVRHPFSHLWKSIILGILVLVSGILSLNIYNYFKDDNRIEAATLAPANLATGTRNGEQET